MTLKYLSSGWETQYFSVTSKSVSFFSPSSLTLYSKVLLGQLAGGTLHAEAANWVFIGFNSLSVINFWSVYSDILMRN